MIDKWLHDSASTTGMNHAVAQTNIPQSEQQCQQVMMNASELTDWQQAY